MLEEKKLKNYFDQTVIDYLFCQMVMCDPSMGREQATRLIREHLFEKTDIKGLAAATEAQMLGRKSEASIALGLERVAIQAVDEWSRIFVPVAYPHDADATEMGRRVIASAAWVGEMLLPA